MNTKYTTDFILSFENTIHQPRFEELETTLRDYKQFLQLYEDNTNRCKKVIMKLEPTSETQQILSNITIIENRVKKYKSKKVSFDENDEKKEKKRPIRKPTEKEMERLSKSMSLPTIKMNQSSQRNVEHQLLVDEFAGQFFQMTKHSSGTQLLMKLIENANKKELESIVEELDDHLEELIIHQNGQYILPKIMEKRNESINEFIFNVITENLISYCCDLYGGYTIQKISPFIPQSFILQWKPILKQNLCTLILNQHGNYVVQTLFKSFGEQHSDFFFDGIHENFMRICTSKIGCSVLTNAINSSSIHQLQQLKNDLIEHCKELLIDQYGNFILQHYLENDNSIIPTIIDTVKMDIVYYSNHKFSSNVIEKCLLQPNHFNPNNEILFKKEELIVYILEEKTLIQLLDNQYGNFVVQALIDSLPKEKQNDVKKLIIPQLSNHSQFAHFIEKKLKTTQIV